MRAFLAIALPDAVAERFGDLQAALRIGRPVPEDQLHLTLAFLDEQPDDALEELHFALGRLRLPPVPISFGTLGSFGEAGPRTVHAEVQETPALLALHRAVKGAIHVAGITLGRRRFRPHVTFARLPQRLTAEETAGLARFLGRYAASPLPGFEAPALTLFRSTLRRDGAVYDALADYPLAG